VQSAKRRPPRTLRQRAVALLARRDYARAALTARLAAAGGTRDEIEPLLDELQRAGYLCDARLASTIVGHKRGAFGKRAIAHALREKGVDDDVARQALAALEGVDEVEAAFALWRRRFDVAPAGEREKARQLRFLQSRGYSATVAFKVLKLAGARVADEWPAGG
jgi:regulatory protein